MVQNLTCPTCGGKGVLLVLLRGSLDKIKCHCCDGVGKVTAEHFSRIERGDLFRKYRVELLELGLREAAERWGMKPSELSYIEQGKTTTDWTPPGWTDNASTK